MTDMFRCTNDQWYAHFASQWKVESADRVHSIEQAKEMHLNASGRRIVILVWLFVQLAEGRLEGFHVIACFVFALLVVLIHFVCKWNHLFIAHGEQANVGDHPSEESCRECAAGEAKDVNVIASVVMIHDETIA